MEQSPNNHSAKPSDQNQFKFHVFDPTSAANMTKPGSQKKKKNRNFYIPTSAELANLSHLPASEAADILHMSKTKVVYLRRRYKEEAKAKEEEEQKKLQERVLAQEGQLNQDLLLSATKNLSSSSSFVAKKTGEKKQRPAPYNLLQGITKSSRKNNEHFNENQTFAINQSPPKRSSVSCNSRIPSFDEFFLANQRIGGESPSASASFGEKQDKTLCFVVVQQNMTASKQYTDYNDLADSISASCDPYSQNLTNEQSGLPPLENSIERERTNNSGYQEPTPSMTSSSTSGVMELNEYNEMGFQDSVQGVVLSPNFGNKQSASEDFGSLPGIKDLLSHAAAKLLTKVPKDWN